MSYEVLSAVHGTAPRSDELLLLGTAVEKGRAKLKDFEELRDHETTEWLALQAAAGIDIYEDGRLRWQDRLRPLVAASEGFSPDIDDAPVTRWYETNTFYRQPTIAGPLRFDVDRFRDQVGGFGETISLPASSDVALRCDTERDVKSQELRTYYSQITRALGEAGVKRLIYTRHNGAAHPESFAHELVAADQRHAPEVVVLRTTRTASYAQRSGQRIPASRCSEAWYPAVVGDDTIEDRYPSSQEIDFLAGQGLSKLVLTNSVDLEFLPLPYARRKVWWLAEIANYIAERLS